MSLNKKKNYTPLVIVFTFLLTIFHVLGWLKPIERIFEPVANFFKNQIYILSSQIYETQQTISRIQEYKNENDKLKEEIINLTSKASKVEQLTIENEILKTQIGIDGKGKIKYLMANVIDASSLTNPEYISINIGSEDGVKQGEAVVFKEYAIGEVITVNPKSSLVQLITSSNTSVPIETENTKAQGILKKDLKNNLVMTLILPEEVVNVGDLVVTSGLKSKFPKGFIIGKIQKVDTSLNGFNKEAQLEVILNFSKLSSVFVIKD